jgi:hypothetical protein
VQVKISGKEEESRTSKVKNKFTTVITEGTESPKQPVPQKQKKKKILHWAAMDIGSGIGWY